MGPTGVRATTQKAPPRRTRPTQAWRHCRDRGLEGRGDSDPHPNAPPDTALYNMAKSKTLPHAPLARLLTITRVPGVWEGTALLVTRRRRLNERVGTFSPTTTSGLQGGKRSRRLSSSSRAQT